jgi:hypothetical protein
VLNRFRLEITAIRKTLLRCAHIHKGSGAWISEGEILGFLGYFYNGASIFEKNRTLEFTPETLLNYRSLLE